MAEVSFESNAQLERLMASNKETEKKVRKIVKQVVIGALGPLERATASEVQSRKQAEKAVRAIIYKKILGGAVTILPSRRRSGNRANVPAPTYKLETQTNIKGNHRGGNRMKRTQRTWDLLGYMGSDRGFILRFLNTGTPKRERNNTRFVGQITARNWFYGVGQRAMETAAENLSQLLDKMIAEEFNTK